MLHTFELADLQFRKDSWDSTAHLDQGAFIAHPSLETAASVLDADTALLPATDGHLGGAFAPGVDPGDAGLELLDDAMALVDIGTEDASGQAQLRVVRALDDLLDRRVGQDGHDGAEDFFLHDFHLVGAVGEHGGLHPESVLEVRWEAVWFLGPAAQELRLVFLNAPPDVAQHFLVVDLAHQRAVVGGRVGQVSCLDECHLLENFLLERGFEFLGHEHSRPVGADLA